ncbi:camk protein kinase [Plasmopara halstedii]|uniref:Camk protein kinase n=1 Tax=Plasmopara halstedii TaxID=4781 RepID=A0A0N7L762_PLAHL|nr:camk protein kinase [Plasmopara halstedii]CEG46187.1 camk protein kinase [Plasmopara halstedii]|eukprot:XP_024582556.1 camk protein kinase [Plasmopara halstedii]
MSKQGARQRDRLVDRLSEQYSSSKSGSSSSGFTRRTTRRKSVSREIGQNPNDGIKQNKKEGFKKAERIKQTPLLDKDVVETVYSAMTGQVQRYASRFWLEQFAKYEEAKCPGSLKTDKFVRCLNKLGIKFDKSEQYEALADCFRVSGVERIDSDGDNSNQKDKSTQLVDYSAFVDFACNVRDSTKLSEIATSMRKSISQYDGKKQSSTSYNMATGLEKLDRHKRGWITSTQFKRALQREDQGPQIRLSKMQINMLVDRFEYEYENQQLGIDYLQFARWLQPLLHLELKSVHERLRMLIEDARLKQGWSLDEVFRAMDVDKDGAIDEVELKEALLDMGLPLTDAQIRCLADEYDVDGDGKIQCKEFFSLFAYSGKSQARTLKRRNDDFSDMESNMMLDTKKRDRQKRNVRNSFSWGINKAFARKQASKNNRKKSLTDKNSAKDEDLELSEDTSSEIVSQRRSERKQKRLYSTVDEAIADRGMKQRHLQEESNSSDEGKKNSSLTSDDQRQRTFTAKSIRKGNRKRAVQLSSTESEQEDTYHKQRRTRAHRTKRNDRKRSATSESDDKTRDQKSGSLNTRTFNSSKKPGMKSTDRKKQDLPKSVHSQSLALKSQDRSRSRRKPPHRQTTHLHRSTSSLHRRRQTSPSRPVRRTSMILSGSDAGGSSDISNDRFDSSSGLDVAQLRHRQKAKGLRKIHRNSHAKHTQNNTEKKSDEYTIKDSFDNNTDLYEGEERSLSDEEYHKHLKRSLRRAFDFFDLDQTSTIDKRELGHVLRALGHEFTSKELEVEMANADLDRNGQLDFYEFVTFVKSQIAQKTYLLSRQREMEIRQSFQSLDTDKNGSLNEQEFEYLIYKVLQVELSIEEQNALLDFIDKDADGVISEEEFIVFLRKLETLYCKYSQRGSLRKQEDFMVSLDTHSQLAYSAMKKLVRGAPMDIDRSLLMFFGIPSNFRPAISSAATCRALYDNTMEHVLSFPSPQTIEALALDTTLSEKKSWFTPSWLDTNSEEFRMLQIAESVEAQAIVSLKRAAGVPKPFDTREDDVMKRCVHVCLFQEQEKTANSRNQKSSRRQQNSKQNSCDKKVTGAGIVVGNVHEIPVYWHQGEEDVWEFSRKSTKEDKYKFLVRTNTVNDHLYLLVEFIIHLRLNSDENQSKNKRYKHWQACKDQRSVGDMRVEEETREMVCCWCKIPVRQLLAKRSDILRHKEILWGGTANAPVDIEQDELLRRRTGWRALTNMFTKPSPPIMGIKSVPIDLLSDDLQSFVRQMPPIVIAPFVALPILAEYMILVRKSLACVAGSSSVVMCEPALKLLPKIVDDYAALSIFRKAFDIEVAGIKSSEDRRLKFQQLVLRMWPSFVHWQEHIPPSILSTNANQSQNSTNLANLPPNEILTAANSASNEENLQIDTQMRLKLLETTASGKLRLQDIHVASTPFHVREVAFRRML